MAKKIKGTSKKRSSRKILDAFQIAERAENGSDSANDSDDLEVQDGVLDASRFLKEGSRDDDDDEDEELDSDEALGSDDDYDILNSKFSQTIRDKKKKDRIRKNRPGSGEQSDDEEAYDSIDENQLVSLSEAWDMDEADLSKSKSKDVVLDDAWDTASSEEEEGDSEDSDESEDDDESESDVFDVASDEENDLANTVLRLQSQIKKPKEKKRLITETRDENEFNVPASTTKLSLQDMLAVVDDSVSKDAILIDCDDSKAKALATPLPKRIQERHDRKVAYEMSKEEVSKWKDTIEQNKRADVLKFPMNQTQHNDTANTFRDTEVGSSELEQKINALLEQSALVDDKKEATFEEIAVAKLSVTEMRKRTNELRMMRELMFRDEKRARRIKKIKSKQYHKIKKREERRNQEMVEGSDLSEEDDEDHDVKRAKERMTLRHKTQSLWAKSMIKSGLSKDASNRGELEDMLRQGEKLRAKQLGYEDGDQSDDAVSDIEREYNNDNESADENNKNKLGKGVLAMDFMKAAEERTKQANKRELEELRQMENGELDDLEAANSVNVTKNQGRRVYAPNAAAMKEDVDEMNIEMLDHIDANEAKSLVNRLSKADKVVETKTARERILSKEPSKQQQDEEQAEEVEENPWLTSGNAKKSKKVTTVEQSSSKLSKSAAKIAKSKKRSSSQRDDEDVDISVSGTLRLNGHTGSDSEDEDAKMFTQKDLIKQAFAGDDVVAEFEAEKKEVIADEGDKEEDITLPGWGGWAGSDQPKRKKVVRKIDGVVQLDKRKDKYLKSVIINERVNKKNLKYQSSGVPYPFETREQYERSLRMPVGQEWTSKETHQRLTMPRVITKQGTVIDPLKAPFK